MEIKKYLNKIILPIHFLLKKIIVTIFDERTEIIKKIYYKKKFIILVVVLLFFIFSKNSIYDDAKTVQLNRDNISGVNQPFPFLKNEKEIYNDLKEYSVSSIKAKCIFDNYDKLSETYRKMLANNKDTTDYIYGYLTNKRVDFELGETYLLKRKYPYYAQWDRRWGYDKIGETNIAIGGCGPTSCAMLLSGELNDDSITPNVVSKIEEEGGYFSQYGTKWDFFEYIAKYYNLNCKKISVDKENIDKELTENNPIIASVKPGKFTTIGHIILIVGINDDGEYLLNDPNSLYRSIKKWKYKELSTEINSLWVISKK